MKRDKNAMKEKMILAEEMTDFPSLEAKLKKMKEGFLFQNDRPTHVIMTIGNYRALQKKAKKNDVLLPENDVENLLQKVGKRIFVQFYYVFRADENPEAVLEAANFSPVSSRGRSAAARSIFQNELQCDALRSIIASDRIEYGVIQKAKQYLAEEQEDTEGETTVLSINEIEEKTEIKVGKMIRYCLEKLLKNGCLSEEECQFLQTKEGSKKIFNLNFCTLKEIKSESDLKTAKRDARGYNRYYDFVVPVNGKYYLISSQWTEGLHRTAVENWLVDKMTEVVLKTAEAYPAGKEFCVRDVLEEYWPFMSYPVKLRIDSKCKSILQERGDIEPTVQKESCQYYWKKG